MKGAASWVLLTKAERHLARDEVVGQHAHRGLADFDSVVDGRMTPELTIKASLARATGRGIANDHLPAQGDAGTNVGEGDTL